MHRLDVVRVEEPDAEVQGRYTGDRVRAEEPDAEVGVGVGLGVGFSTSLLSP